MVAVESGTGANLSLGLGPPGLPPGRPPGRPEDLPPGREEEERCPPRLFEGFALPLRRPALPLRAPPRRPWSGFCFMVAQRYVVGQGQRRARHGLRLRGGLATPSNALGRCVTCGLRPSRKVTHHTSNRHSRPRRPRAGERLGPPGQSAAAVPTRAGQVGLKRHRTQSDDTQRTVACLGLRRFRSDASANSSTW